MSKYILVGILNNKYSNNLYMCDIRDSYPLAVLGAHLQASSTMGSYSWKDVTVTLKYASMERKNIVVKSPESLAEAVLNSDEGNGKTSSNRIYEIEIKHKDGAIHSFFIKPI